jgi:hypothetical protein
MDGSGRGYDISTLLEEDCKLLSKTNITPFVQIRYYDYSLSALVDTGSNINLISNFISKILGTKMDRLKTPCNISGFDRGGKMRCNWSSWMKINIGTKTFEVFVYILRIDLSYLLLGGSFLKDIKVKAALDYGTMEMRVAGEVVEMLEVPKPIRKLTETDLAREAQRRPEEMKLIWVRNDKRIHLRKGEFNMIEIRITGDMGKGTMIFLASKSLNGIYMMDLIGSTEDFRRENLKILCYSGANLIMEIDLLLGRIFRMDAYQLQDYVWTTRHGHTDVKLLDLSEECRNVKETQQSVPSIRQITLGTSVPTTEVTPPKNLTPTSKTPLSGTRFCRVFGHSFPTSCVTPCFIRGVVGPCQL